MIDEEDPLKLSTSSLDIEASTLGVVNIPLIESSTTPDNDNEGGDTELIQDEEEDKGPLDNQIEQENQDAPIDMGVSPPIDQSVDFESEPSELLVSTENQLIEELNQPLNVSDSEPPLQLPKSDKPGLLFVESVDSEILTESTNDLTHIYREKAKSTIENKRRKKLDRIMNLFLTSRSISNAQVGKLLHLSRNSANHYIAMLIKEGKIKKDKSYNKINRRFYYSKSI